MGPTWVLLAPDGPHIGPMNLAIRAVVLIPWEYEYKTLIVFTVGTTCGKNIWVCHIDPSSSYSNAGSRAYLAIYIYIYKYIYIQKSVRYVTSNDFVQLCSNRRHHSKWPTRSREISWHFQSVLYMESGHPCVFIWQRISIIASAWHSDGYRVCVISLMYMASTDLLQRCQHIWFEPIGPWEMWL